MRILILLSMLMFSLTLLSCGDIGTTPDGTFAVNVSDQYGQPVEGVNLYVRSEYEYQQTETDNYGIAYVRDKFKDQYCYFYRDNYFKYEIDKLSSDRYFLRKTLKEVNRIGIINEAAVYMTDDKIITLEFAGDYRAFDYDDSTIYFWPSFRLCEYLTDIKIFGDTLLALTDDDFELRGYLLNDPEEPEELFRVLPSWRISNFAMLNSCVIIKSSSTSGVVETYAFPQDSVTENTAEVDAIGGDKMAANDGYLYTFESGSGIYIYRLSNPSNLEQINYIPLETGYDFVLSNDLILVRPSRINIDVPELEHTLINISDPLNPTVTNVIAEGYIEQMTSKTTAIGKYRNTYHSDAIFELRDGRFKTVAICADNGSSNVYHGVHPYYIFSNTLVKLVE